MRKLLNRLAGLLLLLSWTYFLVTVIGRQHGQELLFSFPNLMMTFSENGIETGEVRLERIKHNSWKGENRSYSLYLKGEERVPSLIVEKELFYKEYKIEKIYDALEQDTLQSSIPVEWVESTIYGKPIFTKINNNSKFHYHQQPQNFLIIFSIIFFFFVLITVLLWLIFLSGTEKSVERRRVVA